MSAVIAFENADVRYGGRTALSEVSLTVSGGAVTGVVGPNGAGKTTLLRAALGLLPLAGGVIRILDKPLPNWPREALARAAAYLPQGGEAKWPMQARDVVLLGRLPYRAAFAAPQATDWKAVNEALARCDATGFAERRMNELSAGERARVLLARALATRAPVLLADEPAAFLDPAHQIRLMELLREEARRGTAVVVTLHDLPLAAHHCDEIVVLHEGKLAARGASDEALSDEMLARVFGIVARRVRDGGRDTLTLFRRI
ncbi:MAG: ABC transporter ATP-binding protein [Alphaproteobacteria bacterium]|nr:ABC transporter ATP-binding protein [Alphaproteobacteria bacterium]MDE2111639.1 ABC transporter ATP-binding protein [Alphaproteobacteria bacterium]MDE2494247.1 ABC transporter ATP-binding protein [Alphaproteobacteria bacterium]